jgi:drug/metabolite transporter (DMT)-like permease
LSRGSWVPYAVMLVILSGIWGATSGLPTTAYGYPVEMVYVIWAAVMLIPASVLLRGASLDASPRAAAYGLLIGLTGAGGQLLLLRSLTLGPAYVIFPIIALSPTITVVLAIGLLRERIPLTAALGVIMALVAVVLFGYSGGDISVMGGSWLLPVIVVTVAWGVQAYLLRKAATVGIDDVTTFGYMTLSGLLLIPVAFWMMGGLPHHYPWHVPALAGGTQLLNAMAALLLVMALSRGRASVVVPVTSALSPVLTTILSLAVLHTWPTAITLLGMALALTGSALTTFGTRSERGVASPR